MGKKRTNSVKQVERDFRSSFWTEGVHVDVGAVAGRVLDDQGKRKRRGRISEGERRYV